MDVRRGFRVFRLCLGCLLLASWAAFWLVLLIGSSRTRCAAFDYADCGDLRRGAFLYGAAASPVLVAGLLLVVSGLPPRPAGAGPIGALRFLLRGACFGLAGIFALCSLVFVADVGAGTGAEILFLWLAATATACLLAGRRVGH